jgi:amidase
MHRTQRAWRRAEQLGGKDALNCIAEINESALEEANYQGRKPSEASGMPGELLLRGVPVLVKDNIDVKGMHTTAGSLALEDNIALEDAHVIKNLRRHGAVILGKTNMTEFANYVSSSMPGGYSSRGGQVKHAVSEHAEPGGSSTGSGVAVSAGIVSMAVGTDTSFSIIACAKFNGICGIKPPVGILSQEGIIPVAKTLDSPGPMAETFLDALRMYRAMRDEPFPDLRPTALDKLRIAVNQANLEHVEEGEKAFLEKTLEKLKAAGTSQKTVLQEKEPMLKTIMKWEFRPMLEKYLRTSTASRKTLAEIVEFYETHPDTMMKYGHDYLKEALEDTPDGLFGEEYLEALRHRKARIEEVRAEISDVDAVIMTGPTNVMHFCGLPSVTIAGSEVDEHGVRRAIVMYGADEKKLYSAALAIERVILGGLDI